VFPEWVRVVLRQHFGHHGPEIDEQFEGRPDVYNVTMADIHEADARRHPTPAAFAQFQCKDAVNCT